MQTIIVNLAISADKLERWYRGRVRDVLAYSIDGRKVRFPVGILQPYVTRQGIAGRFRIIFADDNRFERIEKID